MNFIEKINSNEEFELTLETRLAKFHKFAKEHFLNHYQLNFDYSAYIKRSSIIYNLQIPEKYKEIFIQLETGYLFLLCDIPEFRKAEEYLNREMRSKNLQFDNFKSVKEFYHKWSIIKVDEQRKYFGISTIKFIEKAVPKTNFMNNLLHAAILIYDSKLFAPDKALELLDEAKSVLSESTIPEEIKKSILYYFQIFRSFAYIKKYFYREAIQELLDALNIKPDGFNAKYYLVFLYKKLKETDSCSEFIQSIIDSDVDLLAIAVKNCDPYVLDYVLNNAGVYSFYVENEFFGIHDELERIILSKFTEKKINLKENLIILDKLNDLKLNSFFDDNINSIINFIVKVSNDYGYNKNIFINHLGNLLYIKLNDLFKLILLQVQKKNDEEIQSKILPYNDIIKTNEEYIGYSNKDCDDSKRAIRGKLEDTLANIEKNNKEILAGLESRIENLQHEKKFNPRATFNSSMLYNFIVTMLVFTISGFSGCYNGTIQNVYNFSDVALIILFSGLKWGSITFLIGIIISIFTSGFTILEKVNEKQFLLSKIQFWKNQLEQDILALKDDSEKKIAIITKNFSEKIERYKVTIEQMKKEKIDVVDKLKAEYQIKTTEISNLLSALLP